MEKTFIGVLTRCGKKTKAKTIFYSVMSRLMKKYKLPVNEILAKVLDILSPTLNFTIVKRGSSTYIHPKRITDSRSKSIVVSWIVKSAYSRTERGIISKLEGEFNDLLSKKGKSLAKRLEFHKRAVSNRFALKNIETYTRKNYYYSFTEKTNTKSDSLINIFNSIKK